MTMCFIANVCEGNVRQQESGCRGYEVEIVLMRAAGHIDGEIGKASGRDLLGMWVHCSRREQ